MDTARASAAEESKKQDASSVFLTANQNSARNLCLRCYRELYQVAYDDSSTIDATKVMNSKLRQPLSALRSIGLYTLAIGLVNGANFLTAPLLVALLGKSEFARWGLLEPIIVMGITLAGFGLQTGLMWKIKGNVDDDRCTVEALLPFYFFSAVLVGFLSGCVAWWIGETGVIGLLIASIVFAEAMMVFVATLWRCQDFAGLYVIFEGGRSSVVIVVLILILHFSLLPFHDIEGYLWLRVFSVLAAMLAAYLLVRPMWHPDSSEALSAFAYGGPIVLASLCSAMLTSIDRYALATWENAAILATYFAHVKLSQVLGSILMPFYTWFAPKAVQWLEIENRDQNFILNTTSVYFVGLAAICASLWLASPTIWPFIFPTIIFDRPLFGILLIGAAIYAFGNPVSIGVLRPGKTYQALVITLVSMVTGAGACFAFAPALGSIGVSLGRGLGLILYTALFAINTTRSLKINYHWALYATISVVLAGVCFGIEALIPNHDFLSLSLKLILLGSAALALLYWTIRITAHQKGLDS